MSRAKSRRKSGRRPPAPHATEAWVLPLLVVSCTFLAFAPVFQNGFVDWDDAETLTGNPSYRGLGWSQLRWMWTTTLLGHYIPLTWMTFGLDYLVWGMNPAGYHLTSLLLHVANAFLFYVIVARLLSLGPANDDPDRGLRVRLGAAFAALVFAAHPLRVESVAWATERRDILCGLFFLGSLLAYLRDAETPRDGRPRSRRWYWVSLGCMGAAVLSKSMAVTLPAILVILDFYPLRRLGAGPRAWFAAPVRRLWVEKLPFLLVAIAGSATVVFSNRENLISAAELGVTERLAISVQQVPFYLWKTISPIRLAPLYELRPPIVALSWPVLLGAAVMLAVTVAAILLVRRWPGVAAAWLASLIMLLPVSGLFQNGPQIAADRYTYLPTLSWAVLAGAALSTWSGAWWRRGGVRRAASLGAPAVVIAVLGALTTMQTQIWRDPERLWTHAVAVAPSSGGHYYLGIHFDGQGKWPEAIDHYRQALRIKPDRDVHYNLGVDLARVGEWDDAIAHYRAATQFKRNHAEAHYNWGIALARLGRGDEAIEHYRLALEFKPDFGAAHNNWGTVLARQGRWNEAIGHYAEAVRIKPDHAEAHNNLAGALAQQGRVNEAVTHFRQALRIRPDFAEARQNLDRLLAHQAAPR